MADQNELAAAREQLRRIGFNDVVREGGDEVHVQTEVTGREALRLRTTVHRQGQVLDVIVTSLGPAKNVLALANEVFEETRSQHDAVLARARAGTYRSH